MQCPNITGQDQRFKDIGRLTLTESPHQETRFPFQSAAFVAYNYDELSLPDYLFTILILHVINTLT